MKRFIPLIILSVIPVAAIVITGIALHIPWWQILLAAVIVDAATNALTINHIRKHDAATASKNDINTIKDLTYRLDTALIKAICNLVPPGTCVNLDFFYCKERFRRIETDAEGKVTVTLEAIDFDDRLKHVERYPLTQFNTGEKLALYLNLKDMFN